MKPETFRHAQELLEAALEIPTQQRTAWLEHQTSLDPALHAEVRELIAADRQAEEFLEVSAIGAWLERRREEEIELAPGACIGPYRIEAQLGRGGMGRVMLAVRDDAYRQQVAIKIADTALSDVGLARLRRERQILAGLDHPHIARLLDGGATALGQPYLVMELVQGVPIDRFCDGLALGARLDLFRRVLAAVAYAHRHLVLHLDLKPANILVDAEGQPKLLDFGIAKLLGSDSETPLTVSPRPLTPDYASPEQLRGERLATASDVYSLGRILYRMLTGRPMDEAARRQREEAGSSPDLPPPSRATSDPELRRRLRGDLDAIVSKALAPRPEARYASVEELDADLERHLDGRPIAARPPTRLYPCQPLLPPALAFLDPPGSPRSDLLRHDRGGLVESKTHRNPTPAGRDPAERRRSGRLLPGRAAQPARSRGPGRSRAASFRAARSEHGGPRAARREPGRPRPFARDPQHRLPELGRPARR